MPYKSKSDYNAWRRLRYHERYSSDPEYRKNHCRRVAKNIQRKLDILNDYKSKHPCVICEENEPVCLDFHHLNGDDKTNSIGQMIRKCSIEAVMEEIKKCIIVCSNCHRKINAGMIDISMYRVANKEELTE